MEGGGIESCTRWRNLSLWRYFSFSSGLKALMCTHLHLQIYWRCTASFHQTWNKTPNTISHSCKNILKKAPVPSWQKTTWQEQLTRVCTPSAIHTSQCMRAPWTGRSPRSFVSWSWSVTSQWTLCVSMDPAAETEARKRCFVECSCFCLFCFVVFSLCLQFCLTQFLSLSSN